MALGKPTDPHFLLRIFPILRGWSDYNLRLFTTDLLAGVTVAILIVPHSIAQAALAGMPPQAGLYSAIAAPILYGMFGSSRTMAVGPVALTAIISATGVASLNLESEVAYVAAIGAVTLVAGLLQIGLGAARLGFLTRYMSAPMLSGLLTAIALIIALNEVDHFVGIDVPRQASTLQLVVQLVSMWPQADWVSIALGVTGVILMLLMRRVIGPMFRRYGFPVWSITLASAMGPLVAVLVGVALVFGLALESVQLVGAIPAGLPEPAWPVVSSDALFAVIRTGITVGLLAYVQSIVMAKNLAARTNDSVGPDQDLFALGLANMASGLTGGFAVAGSVSRSMVNYSAGAQTGMASIVTGLVLAISVAVAAPVFGVLPYPMLAAIVMVAVSALVDFRSLIDIWRAHKLEAVIWLLTFVVVLAAGIELGLFVGLIVSLIVAGVQQRRASLELMKQPTPCEHVALYQARGALTLLTLDSIDTIIEDVTNQSQYKYVVIDCQPLALPDYSSLSRIVSWGQNKPTSSVAVLWVGRRLTDYFRDGEHPESLTHLIQEDTASVLRSLDCAMEDGAAPGSALDVTSTQE